VQAARYFLLTALQTCGPKSDEVCAHLSAVLLKLGEDVHALQGLSAETDQGELDKKDFDPLAAVSQDTLRAAGDENTLKDAPETQTPAPVPESPSHASSSSEERAEASTAHLWEYGQMNEGLLDTSDSEQEGNEAFNELESPVHISANNNDEGSAAVIGSPSVSPDGMGAACRSKDQDRDAQAQKAVSTVQSAAISTPGKVAESRLPSKEAPARSPFQLAPEDASWPAAQGNADLKLTGAEVRESSTRQRAVQPQQGGGPPQLSVKRRLSKALSMPEVNAAENWQAHLERKHEASSAVPPARSPGAVSAVSANSWRHTGRQPSQSVPPGWRTEAEVPASGGGSRRSSFALPVKEDLVKAEPKGRSSDDVWPPLASGADCMAMNSEEPCHYGSSWPSPGLEREFSPCPSSLGAMSPGFSALDSALPSVTASPFFAGAATRSDFTPPSASATSSDIVSVRVLNGVSGEEEVRFTVRTESCFSEQQFFSKIDSLCQQHAGQALSDLNWLDQPEPGGRFQRRPCDLSMIDELSFRENRGGAGSSAVLLLCTVPARPPSELPACNIRLRNLRPDRVGCDKPEPIHVQLLTSALDPACRYSVAFTHQWSNVTYTAEAKLLPSGRGVELEVPRQMYIAASSSTEGLYNVYLVIDGKKRSENRRAFTVCSLESELSSSSASRSVSTSSFVAIGRT